MWTVSEAHKLLLLNMSACIFFFQIPFMSNCFDLGHGSINIDVLTGNTHAHI